VSRCQHENPPQAKFCLECGARVALTCTLGLLQRVDPLLRSRMGGEKPSPAGALGLQEPGQRVDHHFLGIPGTAEEIDTVAVRVVFLLAARPLVIRAPAMGVILVFSRLRFADC
jgi:hypothetical protein